MSLNWGAYFQRGMSLKRCNWVDHYGYGDRHERNEAHDAGATTSIGARYTGGAVLAHAWAGSSRALRPHSEPGAPLWLCSSGAAREGAGAALLGAHDRLLAATDRTPGEAGGNGQDTAHALRAAAPRVHSHLHRGGCASVGRDRRASRHHRRTGHQAPDAPRGRDLCRPALRATTGDLGGASVQPSSAERLREPPPVLEQDALASGRHRGTQSARARGQCGVSAYRQRAPGRSGRGEGLVSHQRGGLRHAVADRGDLREDQRSLSDAGARSHPGSNALRCLGHSRRQWLAVTSTTRWRN